MIVEELIEKLKKMPNHSIVYILREGALSDHASAVWESRDGSIGIGVSGSVVYHDRDRPNDAPSEQKDHFWEI